MTGEGGSTHISICAFNCIRTYLVQIKGFGTFFLFFSQQLKPRRQQRITASQRCFISTCQHNPAQSSSPMTHIRLSVSQRRCSKGSPGLEDSFSRAHVDSTQISQIGGWAETVASQVRYLALDCALWYGISLSLEVPRSTGGTICPAVCGCEPINTEICWLSSGAVTHQGAVVQESGGEVAAEAERQDVPLPGAEGHFAFWKIKKRDVKSVLHV